MIPIHDISEKNKKEIRMNELVTLTHYDSSKAHRHKYFEFFVFLKGGGTHTIDFIDFPIHDNSIHIVAPGQVHQMKRELDSNGFVFLFESDLFAVQQVIENFLFDHICFDVTEFSPAYHFASEFHDEIKQIVQQSWKEYNSSKTFKNQVIIHQISILILHCLNTQKENNDPSTKNNKLYITFRRLLNTEFRDLKKVKDYAEKLNVSEKQLSEIIQQKTGETASALIYKQIILEAKRLLRSGNPTKEVAYELNFNDPAHFSKFFKSQTGIAPSEF